MIICADGMQKELFYVAASRGRRSVVVITGDKERPLRESVGRSAARKSASELARGAQGCCHRGERRGLAAARDLARRVARELVELPGKVLQRARRERSHERGLGR